MKRLLLLCCGLWWAPSCDRDFDLFEQEKSSISMAFDDAGASLPLTDGVLKDSIKRGYQRVYVVDIRGGSDANSIEVKRNGSQEVLAFSLNGAPIVSALSVARGANNIGVEGVAVGSGKGSLSIVDVYGHASELPYDITVFYNLPPVCRVSTVNIKELSPYEVLIDLSASYDADERFGGYLDQYEYRVGSYYKLNTAQPLIYHIFPTHGAYEIRCRVRDNSGVWSDFAAVEVTMEDM
jgi:hypothetical protein